MIAARVLSSEHHSILHVVGQLEAACALLTRGCRVPPDLFHDIGEFMDIFLNRYHHEKEEQAVFPTLMPKEPAIIPGLTADHGFLRMRGAEYAGASGRYQPGNEASSQRLILAARQHGELVRMHIHLEDGLLTGILRRLTRSEDATLCDAMRRFDAGADLVGRDRVHALVEGFEPRIKAAASS